MCKFTMQKPLQTSVRVSYYRFNSITIDVACLYTPAPIYAYKSHEDNFDLDRKREFEFKFHNAVLPYDARRDITQVHYIAAIILLLCIDYVKSGLQWVGPRRNPIIFGGSEFWRKRHTSPTYI